MQRVHYSNWQTRRQAFRRLSGAHDDIPWHEIKTLRNLHAHDYESVDMELVWEALTIDVPELKKNLEAFL